jgi:hypothetical protein
MAKAASKQTSKPPKSLFTLTDDNRKKLPVVAAIEGTDMQSIVNQALEDFFKVYEKKNGKIPIK